MLQQISTNQASSSSLAAVNLFREMPIDERKRICCGLTTRSYTRGQRIVTQNDAPNDAYFILGGRVRATYFSETGKEVAFADLEGGEMFGVLSALDDLPRSIAVVALSDSLIVRMSSERFREFFSTDPEVAMKIALHLTTLVRRLTERVVEFSTLGVRNRVHAELLRLAQRSEPENNCAEIAPMPTHMEIANRVSTHREAVTRELSRLEKEVGLIDRADGALRILDVGRLRRLVQDVVGE